MRGQNKPSYDKPTTVLGENTVIEGALLKAKASIQINGKYIGNLEVEGSVVIGEKGTLEGNTTADYLLIAGKHIGNIQVNKQVHIRPNGKVIGDIVCGSIIIEEGAYLEGMCKMKVPSNVEKQKK